MVTRRDELLVLPALRAAPAPDDAFVLTSKFAEGVRAYAERWPGPVRVLVGRRAGDDGNLDPEVLRDGDLPFGLGWLDEDDDAVRAAVARASTVLASLVPRHEGTAAMCRAAGVPLVYVSEYTIATRRAIIRTDTRDPLRRARRLLYEQGRERRNRAAVRLAAGVQCNGTPTYGAYRGLNGNCLLYFDTRMRRDMLVDAATLERRARRCAEGGPLRLAYSGRLTAMKGVDHLPAIADALRRRGTDFTMEICGDGDRAAALARAIAARGLGDRVRLRGVLDFRSELVPLVARSVDLFVCPHPQGDPACTYLETMACGVPVAGFANEALAGLVEVGGVGWTAPIGDTAALAARIAELATARRELVEAAAAARGFASAHLFESTMDRRVEHLRAVAAERPREVAA